MFREPSLRPVVIKTERKISEQSKTSTLCTINTCNEIYLFEVLLTAFLQKSNNLFIHVGAECGVGGHTDSTQYNG